MLRNLEDERMRMVRLQLTGVLAPVMGGLAPVVGSLAPVAP